MSLILPKGIFKNSPEIKESIESIDPDPLDPADIAKLWKVYTTTKRRLLDPTAKRLENYWWRIWGSRSRELKGATIARLFTNISDGQSFVLLRGPANRYEGTPQSNKTTHHGPRTASVTALHHPSQSRPCTTSSSAAPRAPVVMPHPILKKTSPSTNRRRPTARFISPNESEDEANPNSTVSPNSYVVVPPPSPNSQNYKTDKKAIVPRRAKKKPQGFVASTAAKKKPVIVRQQSAQLPTGSTAKNVRLTTQNVPTQTGKGGVKILHKPLRSPSRGPQEPDMGAIRLTYDAKGSANTAPALADATGRLDFGDNADKLLQGVMSAGMDKEKGRDPEEAEMFRKRPVPQISEAATAALPEGSLAKSKSQLTLLLEKDRARSAEHKIRDEKGINKNS